LIDNRADAAGSGDVEGEQTARWQGAISLPGLARTFSANCRCGVGIRGLWWRPGPRWAGDGRCLADVGSEHAGQWEAEGRRPQCGLAQSRDVETNQAGKPRSGGWLFLPSYSPSVYREERWRRDNGAAPFIRTLEPDFVRQADLREGLRPYQVALAFSERPERLLARRRGEHLVNIVGIGRCRR
jgi:hypothetical protein